jgi:hypothetical protein
MLQFNGKQEDVKATRIGSTLVAGAQTFNLRCPRNGKTDECAFRSHGQTSKFSFHHSPLSALNKRLGRR